MTETIHEHNHESLQPNTAERSAPLDRVEKRIDYNEQRRQTGEKIAHAREKVEQQALSKESIAIEETAESQPLHQSYITKHIKYDRYKLTLEHLRKHLSPTEQRFSKLIHKPTIETASEWGSKTIARPSGILGGSFLALLGSLIIIVVAKRVGFRVPNSIFVLLFMTGFALGIIAEFGITSIKKLIARR